MFNQKTKDRCAKLLALTKQGVGGEADNAMRMLEKMLKPYGLSISDIDTDTITMSEIGLPFKTTMEKKLAMQIIYMVTNDEERRVFSYKGRRTLYLDATPAEQAEIIVRYDTLKKALSEEMDILFHGFVIKNKIWGSKKERAGEDDITPEDLERLQRASDMAKNINSVNFTKRLEN